LRQQQICARHDRIAMEDRKRETQSQCRCHSPYHAVNRPVGAHQSPAHTSSIAFKVLLSSNPGHGHRPGLCTFSLLMRRTLFPRLLKLYQKSLLRVKTLPPHNLNNGRMRKRRKKGFAIKAPDHVSHAVACKDYNVAYSWKTENSFVL